MIRNVQLPFLPGTTFSTNIGQTKFHKSQHFEHCKNIPILSEKVKPGIGGVPLPYSKSKKYPSAFSRGEVAELPAWIAFDKQILCFEAYFQETAQERYGYAYHIRRVKIMLFLEDGTVSVMEPTVDNSGIPQGTLISRQRIRFPPPRDEEFYDILDFNVGREVELFGRVFKITNCDRYTRTFLNRVGIHVPDPINVPPDPYQVLRAKEGEGMAAKKPNKHIDKLGQFLDFDRKVLRFYGYWDDRESMFGRFHNLHIHYYLADDTIEVKEIVPPNSGCDSGFMFLCRSKVPKVYTELPAPGHDDTDTILNMLNTGFLQGRTLVDALNCGQQITDYYKDCDLAIGAAMNIFNRKVVLTDCDPFTRAYYAKKYGLDDFTPHEHPVVEDKIVLSNQPRPLPPYNGYGTYEDSAGNCRTVLPTPPHKDFNKFFYLDRQGLDSHILRFKAELISKIPADKDRLFIISYFLCDDTIGVFENTMPNTGFLGGEFIKRIKIPKPGEELFASEPPQYFGPQDFFIGNIVILSSFEFLLVDADEYALRYMEINCKEFPKSNIILIMNKIRETLKPIYKQFVCEYLKADPNQIGAICYTKVSKVLREVMGDNITHHEIITLARYFNARCYRESYNKEALRGILHTELRRSIFNQMERLHESFLLKDPNRSGFVPRETAYCVCRGAKVPIDKYLLNAVLDKICVNEAGELDYKDLLGYLDLKGNPPAPTQPLSILEEFSPFANPPENMIGPVDFQAFLKELDLEKCVVEESG